MDVHKDNLYEIFKKHEFIKLLELFHMPKTKDEQDFYTLVLDFLTQKSQQSVIKRKNISKQVERP